MLTELRIAYGSDLVDHFASMQVLNNVMYKVYFLIKYKISDASPFGKFNAIDKELECLLP